MGEDALAKFTQHRRVEAGIGERQVQRILPGDVERDGEGSCAVGQILKRLENQDEREQNRRERGLAIFGIEVGEVRVVELLEQHIADEAIDRIFVEHWTDQRLGIGRDRLGWLGFEAHSAPRSVDHAAESILRRMSSSARRKGRLVVLWVEVGETVIKKLVEQHLADELVDRILGEEIVDQGSRGLGNGARLLWFETHGEPPL